MAKSSYPQKPVLLVDDEKQFLLSAALTLKSAGINNSVQCSDSRKVVSLLEQQEFSTVILDMMMPNVSGSELVDIINTEYPEIPVVIITAVNEVETAVDTMKAGAFDYVVKPVDDSRLISAVRRAIQMREIRSENSVLKEYLLSDQLKHPEAFTDIITQSPAMRSIFQYIEAIATTSLPILVTGETGVGKELFSRAIHRLSKRSGEMVSINVAGLDDNLFSDTLFGHKKGAFTGAEIERKGLIEKAAGGTLFLDEIGDLAIESQVKLLRLLQEGTYYPLGSDVTKRTDSRIVVATNQDLNSMQLSGTFRKDLYYRLKAHHIQIPALQERREDIPLLVDHLLEKAAETLGKKKPTPPRELMTLLKTYPFPGNVRELEGMVFDAVSQHQSGVLSMESFKSKLDYRGLAESMATESTEEGDENNPLVSFNEILPTMKEMETLLIEEALNRSEGNQSIAAELLGMSRKALNNRLIRRQK